MTRIFQTSAIILAMTLSLVSCNQDKIKKLEENNTALNSKNEQLDSTLTGYLTFVNKIDENLQLIREKEAILAEQDLRDPEYKQDKKDQILDEIKAINTLMEDNRKKIAQLQSALENSGSQNAQLNKLTKSLQNRIAERDKTINDLKEEVKTYFTEIVALEEEVSTLDKKLAESDQTLALKEEVIESQRATISNQHQALTTAFVAKGSFKELEEKEVVVREGGILGIGAVEKLSESPNQTAFAKVDIQKTQLIPLDAKRVELVTNHPIDSYHLHKVEDGKAVASLEIVNPEKFWEQSKYLVVLTN